MIVSDNRWVPPVFRKRKTGGRNLENQFLELYHAGCRVNSEFYLRDIDLALNAGEAVAVMGKNASGKSTLFSMLMGLFPADNGEILMEGQRVAIASPQDAAARGILLLGQNQPMFDNLKVYENIYFGQELTRGKMLDNTRMCREAGDLLKRLGIPVSPTAPVRELGHATRQLVNLARAVCTGARLILMDEPSTHLDAADKKMLWETVRTLKQEGKAFLLVTHDPAEALAVSDRIAFMEGGILSAAEPASTFNEETLAARAYGIPAGTMYERLRAEPGAEVLHMEAPGVSMSLRRGEVAALLGDGPLAQALLAACAGLVKMNGQITVNGNRIQPSPFSGIENGVSLALDDEAEEEIASAREMLDSGAKSGAGTRAMFQMRRLGSSLSGTFGAWIGMGKKSEYVTGGNRRRELMERALSRRASLYLLLEPSAGMDVPARMRMYERFGRIAREGGAILFATGNLSEAFGLADRLLVLQEGKLVLDIPAGEADKARALLE